MPGVDRGPASSNSARRSRTRRRITTARSCRSGSPSWSAAGPIIKVGAATETEMKEKKARVEDAMHATKAAVEEGIVAGGGVALLRASKVLDTLRVTGDEQVGVNDPTKVVRSALQNAASVAALLLTTEAVVSHMAETAARA